MLTENLTVKQKKKESSYCESKIDFLEKNLKSLKEMANNMERNTKGDNMKTFFEVALEVLGCVVLVIGMITIFVGAVLQESYRNCPPTAEEIAENPELARYVK